MADKAIAIIGGGLAGLAAGVYAQRNGYRTQIFEHSSQPGGVAAVAAGRLPHRRRHPFPDGAQARRRAE